VPFGSIIVFLISNFSCVLNIVSPLLGKKIKAVPLEVLIGSEGSRKLRFLYFVTKAQDGGKVVSLTHRTSLPSGNTPGTHFC